MISYPWHRHNSDTHRSTASGHLQASIIKRENDWGNYSTCSWACVGRRFCAREFISTFEEQSLRPRSIHDTCLGRALALIRASVAAPAGFWTQAYSSRSRDFSELTSAGSSRARLFVIRGTAPVSNILFRQLMHQSKSFSSNKSSAGVLP